MSSNKVSLEAIKLELSDSQVVKQCAERHNVIGALSAMKVCYLLRHHPDLTVSEIAELIGLSVSATSRCLSKLKANDVVSSRKVAQTVRYQLQTNTFTEQLITQFGTEGQQA